jgi:hypothetical protein
LGANDQSGKTLECKIKTKATKTISCWRIEVIEPDLSKIEGNTKPRAQRWVRTAITLLLVLIVIIAGIAAHSSRQQWWELYMHWVHSG